MTGNTSIVTGPPTSNPSNIYLIIVIHDPYDIKASVTGFY